MLWLAVKAKAAKASRSALQRQKSPNKMSRLKSRLTASSLLTLNAMDMDLMLGDWLLIGFGFSLLLNLFLVACCLTRCCSWFLLKASEPCFCRSPSAVGVGLRLCCTCNGSEQICRNPTFNAGEDLLHSDILGPDDVFLHRGSDVYHKQGCHHLTRRGTGRVDKLRPCKHCIGKKA